MYWADDLVKNLHGRQVINDSKTPSGRVHVGSLRGPVVHDLAYRACLDRGLEAVYWFGSDDYDPFDSIPSYLPAEEFRPYLGRPLSRVPSPQGVGSDYAQYYMGEFIEVLNELGVAPKTYRASQMYAKGAWNEAIETVLDNANKIREVYLRVSGSLKPPSWYPFHAVCEKCGKISTTEVLDWDGKEVRYVCEPDKVRYTKGCGHQGSVPPFDGHGKLPWKLSWCARWHHFGVTIEGAGKDHSVAGGSRDISNEIFRSVFGGRPPLNIPYEFLLVGSKKMSTSAGVGMSAREAADIVPPELLRFLLVRTQPKTAVNFRIDGYSIPRLFDEYDQARSEHLESGAGNSADSLAGRIFEMSQLRPADEPFRGDLPRFTYVATIIQFPEDRLLEKSSEELGRPLSGQEAAELERRARYAKIWLERFAPESEIFQITPELSQEAEAFTAAEVEFLKQLRVLFATEKKLDGESIHSAIYKTATDLGIPPKRAFQILYLCFLGRRSGPRAGVLLASLNRDFVSARLQAAERRGAA